MNILAVVSGGDAPGINTALAHLVRLAHRKGDRIWGAQGGFVGIFRDQIIALSLEQVAPLSGIAGSFLQSSREPVLSTVGANQKLKTALDRYAIDGVLLFGGNGTLFHIPPLLDQWGVRCIGIPTTIDNDVPGTERTLGFDSACNFAYASIEGASATARALPGRIFMVETLGGDTGYLALEIALATLPHAVLLPEYVYDDDWLAERLRTAVEQDGYGLVILSEGVPVADQFSEIIPRLTGIRLRYTKLGHAQRGAAVSHTDRRLAMDAARLALDGFRQGVKTGTIMVTQGEATLATGTIPSTDKEAPDWSQYAFINGLIEANDAHSGD